MRAVAVSSLVAAVVAAPVLAGKCDTDVVPAATLLVPYFEVALDDPAGLTTLFSLHNVDSAPALVKVTVWTDWAVPSVAFEVYLTGYDVETFNLRDLFTQGRLPSTGSGVSPVGNVSDSNTPFPGCNAGSTPGEAPVYPSPAFEGVLLAELRALHTGQMTPLTGKCGGYPWPDGHARGYVTVDVVSRCSALDPSQPGYFDGAAPVADTRNVLVGDVFQVDSGESFAQGEPAVHVEAFPGVFGAGDYTFYRRYVGASGADQREPLGTLYAARFLLGGPFDGGTSVFVWRDTGSPDAEPVECPVAFDGDQPNSSPSWGPLTTATLAVDEQENFSYPRPDGGVSPHPNTTFYAFPWATQRTVLHALPPIRMDGLSLFGPAAGLLYLSTKDGRVPEDLPPLQGWVSTTMSAEGRYSVGERAYRLDSACAPSEEFPRP